MKQFGAMNQRPRRTPNAKNRRLRSSRNPILLTLFRVPILAIIVMNLNLVARKLSLSNQLDHTLEKFVGLPRKQENVKGVPRHKFYRYDEAAPKAIPGTARSHSLPNAIPNNNIIPSKQAENKTYHIEQRRNTSEPLSIIPGKPNAGQKNGAYNWEHNHETDFRTLYLMNPSILPLHNSLEKSNDPDILSQSDLVALTGGDSSVRYVSVFRAYTGCNCFGRDPKLMRGGEQISYLAVALLDENLDVIEGTDVLIDLNAGPSRRKYFRQESEDCRVFLVKGGIYLLCNEQLRHVQIVRKRFKIERWNNTHGSDLQLPYVYPNVHGGGLEITLLWANYKVAGGKNINIFREGSTSSKIEQKYYLQVNPLPHKFRRVNLQPNAQDNSIFFGVSDNAKFEEQIAPGAFPAVTFDTFDTDKTIRWCEKNRKAMNCTTPREDPFFPDNEEHGTACCVRVRLPNEPNEVLVGISHQKNSARKNTWLIDVDRRYVDQGPDRFVSRFIAYSPEYPFRVVARSGFFCFGFADHGEQGGNTLAGTNLHVRLDFFKEDFNCPVIHFVSGFSEVVGDPSKAIIGYGVNDCHPRMMMIEKSEIVHMLTVDDSL